MKNSPPADDDPSADSTIYVLERAQAGDDAALQTLIQRTLPRLRRWARGRLPTYARSGADTEDVVQDVFLRTLRNLGRFRHRTVGGLQAYLRQGVLNRVRDLIRTSKRHGLQVDETPDLPDWKPSPLETAIARERVDRFLEALPKLSPGDRQVVIWRIELGYNADDIAGQLGKSKAATAMTISRAMKRLAKELQVPDPQENRDG